MRLPLTMTMPRATGMLLARMRTSSSSDEFEFDNGATAESQDLMDRHRGSAKHDGDVDRDIIESRQRGLALYWCKFQTMVFHHGMVTRSLTSATREALSALLCDRLSRTPCPTDRPGKKSPAGAGPEIPRIHGTIRRSPTTSVRAPDPAICLMSRPIAALGFSPRNRLRRNPIRRIPERSKSLESFRQPCAERCLQRPPCAVLRVTRCRGGDGGS